MSPTAVNSPSPPVDVLQSLKSVVDNNGEEKVEESVEHDNKNAQEVNKNTQEDDTPVNGGAAEGQKSNEVVQSSPDQSGVDENGDDIIYCFPRNLKSKGPVEFELETVRENGRLQMFKIPYRERYRYRTPKVVRSPQTQSNGRLVMCLVYEDHYDEKPVSSLQGHDEISQN